MTDDAGHPPRWADALLRSLLGREGRESTSGDLVEEYRAVRPPARGRLRADVSYIAQIISVLWRLIWPAALVLAAKAVFLALTVFRPGHHAPHPAGEARPWIALTFQLFWYGSIVGAPGVSLFDGAVYFVIAWRGVQRTRLLRTGVIAATASGLVGLAVLYSSAAVVTPSLAAALLANPALFLIFSVHLLIVIAYSAFVSTLAGTFSRWVALPRRWAAPVHGG